jgi:hypothetical protein
MNKTKSNSLARIVITLLLITAFLGVTKAVYASSETAQSVTVTVKGTYSDGTRPHNGTLRCTSAKIETGKYKKTFWASKISHSWDTKKAWCDITFSNVVPKYSGWVTVYWNPGDPKKSYSSSMYMGWGSNGGYAGEINLPASKNK